MVNKNKKRILLIEPPFYRLFKKTYSLTKYPLSLAYVAAAIKTQTDYEVMVYNVDFSYREESIKNTYLTGKGFKNYIRTLNNPLENIWQEIKNVVESFAPDIVGISVKAQNFASSFMVAKIIKEVNRDILIIAGGPHASLAFKDILSKNVFDVCVRGEGEVTVVELLRTIDKQGNLGDTAGLAYRSGEEIVISQNRGYITDLDSLPFPHEFAPQVLKDYDRYPKVAFQGIFATRGCPYNCFFCGSRGIWGRNVRYRSVANVSKEIELLCNRGVKRIHFEDDTFGLDRRYTIELCESLMQKCKGVSWSCELHVKSVDENIIHTMRKSNCVQILLGIESGNNEILKKIRKNITIEEALDACAIIQKNGISLYCFFMIGFPWDTLETIQDTMLAIRKIKNSEIDYSIFTPYPGTEAYEFCKEKDLITEPFNISLYNHQSPENSFCLNISHSEFRKIAYKIEQMLDTRNVICRFKQKMKKLFRLPVL